MLHMNREHDRELILYSSCISETGDHQLVQARLSSDASSLGSPIHAAASSLAHSPPSVPIAAGSPNSKKITGARRRMRATSTPDKKKDPKPDVIEEHVEEEIIEQVDCSQQQAAPEVMIEMGQDTLFSRLGALVGTLVLSSINPIRLFGLASGASSLIHSPPSPQTDRDRSTTHVYSHPIPVSTSNESLGQSADEDRSGVRQHSHFDARERSPEARRMILATEAALLWIDPYRSLRTLALCLYLTVCFYRLFLTPATLASSSGIFVTPSTFVLGFALLYLARNGMRTMTNSRQTDRGQLSDRGPDEEDRSREEIDVYLKVTQVLEATSAIIIPVIASLSALVHRALSGRKLTSSCVVALSLWIAMVGIEMKIFPAAGFYSASLLILAAFSLPALYIRSREGLDLMVEDSMRMILRLILSANKSTLFLSMGAALLVMNRAPLGIILRVTASSVAAVGVLIWRSNPSQTPAAVASPTA